MPERTGHHVDLYKNLLSKNLLAVGGEKKEPMIF
jgi:hypothetical protein